jgi:hypothetical protein
VGYHEVLGKTCRRQGVPQECREAGQREDGREENNRGVIETRKDFVSIIGCVHER